MLKIEKLDILSPVNKTQGFEDHRGTYNKLVSKEILTTLIPY